MGSLPQTVLQTQSLLGGGANDISAYRAELTGIYSTVQLIKSLCIYHGIKEGAITFGCNGEAALNQAFSPMLPSIDAPSFDILATIHLIRKECPIKWTTLHIKGHQDDHQDVKELGQWGQLNVEADSLAKSVIPRAKASNRHYNIPGEPCSVRYRGQKITNIRAEVHHIIHSEEGRTYWANKDKFHRDTGNFIHWEAIGRVLKGLPRARRNFVTKFCIGMMGVGHCMECWKKWSHVKCPRCGAKETIQHVISHPAPAAREVWTKGIKGLRVWMEGVSTDPQIIELVIGAISNKEQGDQLVCGQDHSLQVVMLQQEDIGLDLIVEGWPAIEWEDAQQAYYQLLNSCKSGRRRMTNLLQKLWNIVWEMWEHRHGVLH